ncbi:hypothetical protein BKA61DRAFT_698692 [Leptodontidium sp. MPI-SDFR-AT-0119]|nr:hypothetical protein BKA61DRAFT_698692 [Leptodontidium sp. MPI-SDFR-AT-0119]
MAFAFNSVDWRTKDRSLPRPAYFQDAFADYDAGRITKACLLKIQDAAVKDTIKRLEGTGQDLVTDGEQRSSSFATYPLTDTLGGTGLPQNLGVGPDSFCISFADGHTRQLPYLTSGPFKYNTYAYDNFALSKKFATKPMKCTVISPSMMYMIYPSNNPIQSYPKENFIKDLILECVKDIRGCFAAGAKRVSIDFTDGRMAAQDLNLLDTFIDLNNKVLSNFTAEERKDIGVHTADVPYHALLPSLFRINAGYFLIQMASETEKEEALEDIGANLRFDADGVKQVAFIGVMNTLNPHLESPEEIRDVLLLAAKHIGEDQLGATDDCGFSPFSIDHKPKYGGADFAREVAFMKIANRVTGVVLANECLDYTCRGAQQQ